MSDTVTIACAITVRMPRKVLNAYAQAVRNRQTGNFVIHIRAGEPLGITFEQNLSLNAEDRRDEIVLG